MYNGYTPPESFAIQSSPDGNNWKGRSQAGAAIGFIVFGAAYLATVIAIFVDISKSSKNYDQQIAADIQKLKDMGLSGKLPEYEAELNIRLSGVKKDDSGDDQLLGEAIRLSYDQYKAYL